MSQKIKDDKEGDKANPPDKKGSDRRDFLKLGVMAAGLAVAGSGLQKVFSEENDSGKKVKVLTTDGKLVEVDSTHIRESKSCCASRSEARIGIPNKKFVMVIDLSRCKDARKCETACQKYHHFSEESKWLKVLKMQNTEQTSPYWMPKPCMHCDKPPCVKVCPVGGTYKRSDGIVLVDNERCIGCRFCMAACPYSARVFNWEAPAVSAGDTGVAYSPETSVPGRKGTVDKCDFCPDILRQGKLPHCVSACPNGVFYFGDLYEDVITNGDESVRFSQLIKEKAGYRLFESLGTEPSVYYLPPANRLFPFKDRVEEETEKE